MAQLTDRTVQAAKPGIKDKWISDGGARGVGRLTLRVRAASAGGSKSLYFRFTNSNGGREVIYIGPYQQGGDGRGTFSLQQARDKARELSSLYRSGHQNLREYLQREKAAVEAALAAEVKAAAAEEASAERGSLEALIDAYCKHLAKRGAQSAKDARSVLTKNVIKAYPDLAAQPAAALTHRDLLPAIRSLVDAGKGRTAGKLRSYLRAAYQLALDAETNASIPATFLSFQVDRNPAARLSALTEHNKAGDRRLSAQELHVYLEALQNISSVPVRSALRLAFLLGGQRPQQLIRAAAADLDLSTRTLTLRDGKGRRRQARLHVLPLTEDAAGILQELLEANRHAQSIFSTNGKTAPNIATLSKAVSDISTRLLAEKRISAPFQLRDLRRTAETLLASLGVSKDVRAQLLSHGLGGVQDRHYDRHDYLLEKLDALTKLQRFVSGLPSSAPGEVITASFSRHAANCPPGPGIPQGATRS